ncbi:hypothetical protein IPZ61_14730 [Streptomyces sioyaensis]|nr:hypothetical protein [Streptomyces sioyaensis]
MPKVGDEVEYPTSRGPLARATVTDIRKGVYYLRVPGRAEWPVPEPGRLKVMRTRIERLEDGDL